MSTNGGAIWKKLDEKMDDGHALAVVGDAMYQAGCAIEDQSGVRKMAVFHSVNGGKTWSRSMLHENASVANAIAARPLGKPLLFAGGQVTSYPKPKSLLYKSINGGATWSEVTDLFGVSGSVNAICFDPSNPKRVLIGTERGVWISDDEGSTWTKPMQEIAVTSLVANPSKKSQFFAGSKQGVWMSADGGKTWSTFGGGVMDLSVARLDFDAKNMNLYAGTEHRGVMRIGLKARRK